MSNKEYFQNFHSINFEKSLVFGTKTSNSSEWIPVVGPIKGSYLVKNGQDDSQDYISDFGLYV